MNQVPSTQHQARLILEASIQAVRPDALFEKTNSFMELRRASRGTERIIVIGAGKAGIPMAVIAEEALEGEVDAGVIVVPDGYPSSLPAGMRLPEKIQVVESGHPIPSQQGADAGSRMLDLVRGLGSDDLVVVLISGGASALLSTPMPGLSVDDLSRATNALLRSGASIHEINTVRKHLSAVGGGRLAQMAYPAALLNYIVSDVVGNDPSYIGSGPCVPDESTFRDARDVLQKYDLWLSVPDTVASHLRSGGLGTASETPDSDSEVFESVKTRVIGSIDDALDGALMQAEELGLSAKIVRSDLSGEASEAGALIARAIADSSPGTCLIWGGETTVTVRGNGVGGRNHELALAAALELDRLGSNASILSAGTDGVDGLTQAAGAWADGSTIARARQMGLDPQAALANNDSGTFFETLGQQVVTGATHTNVMDVVIAVRAG